jgi:peptidoglycan/xylan/chitin deacetylase (PgdA/CDA1 family)
LKELARLLVATVLLVGVRASARPVGACLLYHRTALRDEFKPTRIVAAMQAARMEAQLRFLKPFCRFVAASELLEAVANRRRGGRIPVAITFDDDLPCHAEIAAPLLERLGVPATFFVAGPAGDDRYWWDDLQRAVDGRLLHERDLGPRLKPALGGALRGDHWAIYDVANTIIALAPEKRASVAEQLRAAAPGPPRERLDADGVRLLAHRFEIGFHTVRHDPLATLADEALRPALQDGRDELEELIGRPVRTLGYPHGSADERVAAEARASGYSASFTAVPGPVGPHTDPQMIPRVDSSDDTPGRLAFRLARYLREAA